MIFFLWVTMFMCGMKWITTDFMGLEPKELFCEYIVCTDYQEVLVKGNIKDKLEIRDQWLRRLRPIRSIRDNRMPTLGRGAVNRLRHSSSATATRHLGRATYEGGPGNGRTCMDTKNPFPTR